jgi:GNAT superfamily N-acetyltransferase
MTLSVNAKRQEARDLLNEFDAADALASYYALYHDPNRSALFTHHDDQGKLDAFLARAQTGFDLFRPLVTLRVRGAGVPEGLLREGLQPGRPYLLIVPDALAEKLKPHLDLTDVTRNRVLRLDPARYQPVVNVLVEERGDEAGNPRCEIRRGQQVLALAGVNWRSPLFAEVYVHVHEESRRRGWGKAVVAACAAALHRMEVTPLYIAAEDNGASLELAGAVGFVDTGAREVMAQATLKVAETEV